MGDDCESSQSQPPSPEEIARGAERSLLQLSNRDRDARGLRTVASDRLGVEMAREHAREMARRGKIYHNPKLRTRAGLRELGNPKAVAENVGVGHDAGDIHKAFMKSRAHREVILGSQFRLAGIGVYVQGDDLWVAELFLRRAGGAAKSSASHAWAGSSSSGGDRSDAPALSTPAPAAARPIVRHLAGIRRAEASDPVESSRTIPVSSRSARWFWIGLVPAAFALSRLRRYRWPRLA